ncbi:TonB family protein [Utexia brackfieldae]|uniref:TonB family protein n=1 Tax=Utexia brackfieldae TaxID=3074108 RepID=UPI00370D06B7
MNKIVNKRRIKIGLLTAIGVSIFCHLVVVAVLFYSNLFRDDIVGEQGDLGIKAVMIDLSQVAAPEMSSVENTQKTVTDEKDQEEETTTANDPEPESVEEAEPPKHTDIESKPEQIIPQKPKPKQTKSATKPQSRQEINAPNHAEQAISPIVSESKQYSRVPAPINRPDPDYPRRALDLRIEGSVTVQFDIDKVGKVTNIRIIEAKPSNIFDQAVRKAMRLWTYQPIEAKDLTVTIVFNRDKSVSLDNS